MKKPNKKINKLPQQKTVPIVQVADQKQEIVKPKMSTMLFYVLGGVLLTIALIVFGWFLGRKTAIISDVSKASNTANDSFDPYAALKSFDPEPEAVTKNTFEKLFPNGDEIFDWLLKNDYFEEKEGDFVHPRFVSPEEKFNLKNKYFEEHKLILAILQQANSPRHAFVVKSAEISTQMTNRAINALKEKNVNEAIKDCKIAIDIFPINAKPYILLTKLYLMTGQEQKLFETLTLAGNSYPNFNNILSIIDDADLDQIPLEEPTDNVYLAHFPENKKMAVSFLFDDGEKNVYVNALPIFEKYGYKATIPVVAGMVAEKDDDPYWGSWSDWKDASKRGFEIANHSMYHRDCQKLHGSDFDMAIDQSKELIEKNIGMKVTAFIFPHDSYNDEAVVRVLRGHEVVRSWEFLRAAYQKTIGITFGGPNFSADSANRLVDIGIKRHLWLVANCHGVTTKHGLLSFKSITPAFLENNLSYMHSKGNDVWVDTFTKIYEYMHLRAKTNIEIKEASADATDFVLHSVLPGEKLSSSLTVIIKIPAGNSFKSASRADGKTLKTWDCADSKLCLDVDSYDQNIHVLWSSGK